MNTVARLVEQYGDLQLRPQLQRLLVLELLNDLMSKRRDALRKLGDEAIVGITDLVANEKDPRNLMVVFSILRVIIVEWDIAAHAEVFQCSGAVEHLLIILDIIRRSLLLLSNHIQTSPRRPIWYNSSRSQGPASRVYRFIGALRTVCVSTTT